MYVEALGLRATLLPETVDTLAVPFDASVFSIQKWLYKHAARAIPLLEKRVVLNTDTYLVQEPISVASGSPEITILFNVTRWLVLWQLMLTYQQSLALASRQHIGQRGMSLPVMPSKR